MKLIIDYGNSLVKIAFYYGDVLQGIRTFHEISLADLMLLIEEFENSRSEKVRVKNVIISNVRKYPDEIKKFLSNRFHFIELTAKVPLPIQIKYSTPDTLGNDRIALAVAASGLYPAEDVLIIDAGTCITYDFINKNKEYSGGGISPGILMRYKALHTFTDKLPFVSRFDSFNLIGNSTEDSIRSGIMNGVLAEVDGIIDRYKEEFPGIRIIFTGGDANYFDKRLKNNIFANSNLVLVGLNMILNYNVGN
jgi:type III pantothenate kinase